MTYENSHQLTLQSSIDYADVSVRAFNPIKNLGILYIDEIYDYTQEELLRLPNFGRKSLNEWNDFLQRHGFNKIKHSFAKFVSIKIPLSDYEKLASIAKKNDRSPDAEILAILAKHVEGINQPLGLAERVDKIEKMLLSIMGKEQ